MIATCETTFTQAVLEIDPAAETDRIVAALREQVGRCLRRKGAVVGLSGGIDSSVCAALCVKAFGAERVLGLFMPERDSSPDSLSLGRELAGAFGIPTELEEISDALDGAGCYRRRDEALGRVCAEYVPGCKWKIVLPPLNAEEAYRLFSAVVRTPSGAEIKVRLPLAEYQQIVAATNFKQRIRKMFEYYHADRLRYAVVGTPNLLEYDQGFFVKQGDGAADIKPIAHLYKTQVYRLAEYLGVPAEICRRPPTTDTYSLAQTQEEFYFSLPYHQMDVCLYAKNHGIPTTAAAAALELPVEQMERVYRDIDAKRAMAEYLHAPPLKVSHTDGTATR